MHLVHTDWLHEHQNKAHIHAVYKKPTSDLKTYRPKARGWKNIIHANGKQKKAGVTIFILDKIYLKIKNITRDKDGHYIMVKGSIQKEDTKIVNVCAPNTGAPQCIRQTLANIKGDTDSNTVTVGDFNTPLTPLADHQNRKLIRKHNLK